MKSIIKGIIIGAIVIAVGAAILIAALAFNGWSIKSTEFEMNTFSAEKEFTAIDINIGAGTLYTQYYDGDRIEIVYPSSPSSNVDIYEENGALCFKSRLKVVNFFGSCNMPDTVVKLPEGVKFDVKTTLGAGTANLARGTYGEVEIDVNAGTFKAEYIECTNLECDISAGTINISEAVCTTCECEVSAGTAKISGITAQRTSVDVSAGTAKLTFTGNKSEYGISTKVGAGNCNTGAQTGTTDKTIRVEVSAGTVKLNFGD